MLGVRSGGINLVATRKERRLLQSMVVLAFSLGLPCLTTGQASGQQVSPSATFLPTGCLIPGAVPAPSSTVQGSLVSTPGQPYGLAVSPIGKVAFVATDDPASLEEFSLEGATPIETGPNWWVSSSVGAVASDQPGGLAFTRDGRKLLVAADAGVAVFEVERPKDASLSLKLLGNLVSPGVQPLEVATSPDGRFVFASDHVGSGRLVVFNLQRAIEDGFGSQDVIGAVPLGVLPGGMALSPDGRYLYVVSERRSMSRQIGSLTTLSVATLEKRPTRAVVSTVGSGCGSVRVTASSSRVYVAARNADSLLSFSSKALVTNPRHALVKVSKIGAGPIGVVLVNHDRGLVVADSLASALVTFRIGHSGDPLFAGYVKSGEYPRRNDYQSKRNLASCGRLAE